MFARYRFQGKRWESSKSIRKNHSCAPQVLAEYAQSNGLFKSGLLRTNFCKWLKLSLGETDIVKISKHKKVGGKIEVCCHYCDGDEEWIPIDEAKEDCKLFLGAYAKENNLLGKPGWEKMKVYWLKEVHDVMCEQMRSNEIDSLVSTLYGKWVKAFDYIGPKHWETKEWGSAFKQSLEIEKHGSRLRLPLLLYRQLSPKQRKYVDAMSS